MIRTEPAGLIGRESVVEAVRAAGDRCVLLQFRLPVINPLSGAFGVAFPGIRAVLCHSVWGAEIGRGNNDGNVLVVGAKVVEPELAEQIVAAWLATPFKGEPHTTRLEMIAALERGESLL